MNEIVTLTSNPKGNASYLMERHKFPKRIITEFEKKNTIYMSVPNGHITTELPEVVTAQINLMKPKRLVYHVIGEYSKAHCFCTCLMYHLLYAEYDMELLNGCSWLPVYSINITIPDWSGEDNLRVKRFWKGIKCIETNS